MLRIVKTWLFGAERDVIRCSIDSTKQCIKNELVAQKREFETFFSNYKSMTDELIKAKAEKDHYAHLLESITSCMKDMFWAKDLDGKYIYANNSICTDLLFTRTRYNTVGRDDIEIATARKEEVGDENHTFGEVCGNSDFETLKKNQDLKFHEFGLVTDCTGKTDMLHLLVHKSPLRNYQGTVIGTVGTARDITEEYNDLKRIASETKCGNTRADIMNFLHKHTYTVKNGDGSTLDDLDKVGN